MKLYILQESQGYVIGVFTTRAKAEYWQKRSKIDDGLFIAERNLDTMTNHFCNYILTGIW